MTPRELSIVRDLVARARLAIDVHNDAPARPRGFTGMHSGPCVYCGKPRWHGSVACHVHADLPALDPKYRPQQVAANDCARSA